MGIANIVASMLPPSLRWRWRRSCASFSRWMIRLGSRNGLLADLYCFLTGAFRREHLAMLRGIARNPESGIGDEQQAGQYMLRRSLHRIEKGLIMRPRRKVFAKDYIEKTVDLFDQSCAAVDADDANGCLSGLIEYASGVLQQYFQAAGGAPEIEKAREQWHRILADRQLVPSHHGPVERGDRQPPVSVEQIEQLARLRRSIRWYQDRPVPREMLDRAIEIALQAPSACNRQPFEFRIFDDPEKIRKVGDLPVGAMGFVQQFPCLIVVVGQQQACAHLRDRHVIYIDASLAVMQLLLSFESLGLSSCCYNWPDIEPLERQMSQLLGLTVEERPVMLVSVGYADPKGLVPLSRKKSLDEARSYN